MIKTITRNVITISSIAVAAVLIGSIVAPIQFINDSITSFEIQTEQTETDITNFGPITLPADHEPVHLNFVVPGALQFIPEAEAAHLIPDKSFTLTADEDEGQTVLPTGDPIHFMSFDGQYPSPTLRVTEGDIVEITIVNVGDEIHSIDMHGSQITAVPNFGAVPGGGGTLTYTFVAVNPGVFVYHCEADNVFGLDQHALTGMVGMLIIDPKKGYKDLKIKAIIPETIDSNTETKKTKFDGPAREFALVYSEWYLTDAIVTTPAGSHGGGGHTERLYAQDKMFNNDPSYTHVNGIPFGYAGVLLTVPPWTGELNAILGTSATSKTLSDVLPLLPGNPDPELRLLIDGDGDGITGESGAAVLPDEIFEDLLTPGAASTHLDVNKGEHVRFFIQNAGDRQVAWHIVGEQLDRVTVGNNIMTKSAIQTWGIAPYADATIDVVFEQPGIYAAVNHDYSSLFKGQATIIVVHDPDVTTCDDLEGLGLVFCLVTSGPADQNPSNAIPPVSDVPNTSIDQSSIACKYGIGSIVEDEFGSECTVL